MTLREVAKRIPGARWTVGRIRSLLHLRPERPEGPDGIRLLGHREYVGGYWDLMRDLQFDFMVSNGLEPPHHLWDIACGALRAGTKFIAYLEPGHYHGVDRHRELIDAGVEKELGREMYELRRPDLIVSERFEFEMFNAPPDFALAQSLFTHLPPPLILLCLKNLRNHIRPGGVFFASFLVAERPARNPSEPHDHDCFSYTVGEMEALGRRSGWQPHYIGAWNHPTAEQVMMRYTPR